MEEKDEHRGQTQRLKRELRGFGEQLVGVAGTWGKGMQGRQGPGQDGLRSLDVFLGTWVWLFYM